MPFLPTRENTLHVEDKPRYADLASPSISTFFDWLTNNYNSQVFNLNVCIPALIITAINNVSDSLKSDSLKFKKKKNT